MNNLNHVAIIMDGNSRWATKNNVMKISGYKSGASNANVIINAALECGIKNLTLYALSIDNCKKRPRSDLLDIYSVLELALDQYLDQINKEDISIKIVGNLDILSHNLRSKVLDAITLTQNNQKMILRIAIGYSGKEEVINAIKKLLKLHQDPDSLTYENFQQYLYDPTMPEVDLLIRTGGDARISDFLPMHISYSEIFFIKEFWPDFLRERFFELVNHFKRNIKRNFGAERG